MSAGMHFPQQAPQVMLRQSLGLTFGYVFDRAIDDQKHTWLQREWPEKDPRVPLVSMEMEK